MKIAAVYENVTRSIIAELEQGAAPWVKPWKNGKLVGIMPANAVTGHHYRGINIPILWHSADVHGYPTQGWLTFKQALDKGGHVKKGEKGTQVVFTKRLSVKDEDDEDKQISMLRSFTVFNVAQVDGLPEHPEPPELSDGHRHERAESFIKATGAQFRMSGDSACFIPSLDVIELPYQGFFKNPEAFYAVALHELVHWSGGAKRLNRDLNHRFGTRAYAAEELIAELGAAFLCAHLGVHGELRHASYIASWLELLKHDDHAIFTAASKASVAADYLRAFSEHVAPPASEADA